MSSSPTLPERRGRLRSLDGLRGVAALVVVFHHLSLVFPRVSDMYLDGTFHAPAVGTKFWWAFYSPLHLFTAGEEAVLVFFVLSGLVVSLPALRNPVFDWIAYFPRRLVRLYLPVAASVVLAAFWITLHAQTPATATSWWTAIYSIKTPTLDLVFGGMDLIYGDKHINNPLWSLQWEVLFSILLPLFIGLAMVTRRYWWVVIVGAWVMCCVGELVESEALRFLPVFLMGAVLAARLDDLTTWAEGVRRRRFAQLKWAVLLAVGLTLMILYWILLPFIPERAVWVLLAVKSLTAIGAVIVVVTAALWLPAIRFLTFAPVRWLGRVSFSLYLVHVPIILAVTSILGHVSIPATVAVSLVLSLLAAELFSRFIEAPSHLLSKRVGKWVSARSRGERLAPS